MRDVRRSTPSPAARKTIPRNAFPLNASRRRPPPAESWITPQSPFYPHAWHVPELDAAAHRVRIGGRVETPMQLSLDELRGEFPVHRVAAAVLCAGNRREELNSVEIVAGTTWRQGAVGNAEWTGVRLADILDRVGAARGDLHVRFASADRVVVRGATTGRASISLAKALSPEVRGLR
jgi:sulfite oxidase